MNIPTRPPVIDNGLLSRFEPITLERMDSIRLMNRIDTKYITDTLMLKDILDDARSHGYMVFENNGERLHTYDSIYFDTDDLRMFTEHRRGKRSEHVFIVNQAFVFLRSRKKTTIQEPARSALKFQ